MWRMAEEMRTTGFLTALAGQSGVSIQRERISPPTGNPAHMTAPSVDPTGPLPAASAVWNMLPQGFEGLPPEPWTLPGSILVEVLDAATNDPLSHFEYVVEVIGKRPTRGSSGISHRARAPAPVDMPFNLRIEAEGYQPFWLRQVLLRRRYLPSSARKGCSSSSVKGSRHANRSSASRTSSSGSTTQTLELRSIEEVITRSPVLENVAMVTGP